MIDVMETIVAARKILSFTAAKDITDEEISELRKMNDWDKINTAFSLGVIAGAKSNEPDERHLITFLDKLSPDKLEIVRRYSELRLFGDALRKIKACPYCGSAELDRAGEFITCERCGAGGYVKISDDGDTKLRWYKVPDQKTE